MDFENNKNEQCHSNHDIEELDRIRNQVINNFSSNSSDFYSSFNNNENGSVTLALDDLTVKNIKFMATVIKVLSILGIIVGVFQIIILFLGIFTIIISIKFFKSITDILSIFIDSFIICDNFKDCVNFCFSTISNLFNLFVIVIPFKLFIFILT